MKTELTLAFNEVLEEKQLPRDIIMQAVETALVSAYRRAVNASNAQQVEAKIDLDTGKVRILVEKEVVEKVEDARTEILLSEAQNSDPNTKVGSTLMVETAPMNPGEFGRVAAQTARQVIQQRLREAERDAQMEYLTRQLGEILSGVVQTLNQSGITLGLDMRAEGIMPRNQQIEGERFRIHDRVRALLLEIKPGPRGPQIILSRAHRNFLRRMLENEVPEIYHGTVEIRSIAREPGERSKVAVSALQPGVDPVGACVGIRGVRIQAIVRELHDEKIDVIEWNSDPAVYIAKALSPARVTGVYLNEHARGAKTATVVVPEDHLSLAIGRDGQNARLAAKLTSWRIDIKSLPEAATDALNRLRNDVTFAALAEREAATLPIVEGILAKKGEGRPVTPEEYTLLSQFVDRVERAIVGQRQQEKKAEKTRRDDILASIPVAAFDLPLEDLALNARLTKLLSEVGYLTVGDLMLQMKLDSDMILKLNGVGPKALEEIQAVLDKLSFPETKEELPAPEIAPEPEGVPAAPPEILPLGEVEAVTPAEVAPEAPPAAEALPEQEIPVPSEEKPLVEEEVIPVSAEQPKVSMLEELYAMRPEELKIIASEDEEFEEEEDFSGKKKKKERKKRKPLDMEYDPDKDMTIVKRKRKRGDGGWSDDWGM